MQPFPDVAGEHVVCIPDLLLFLTWYYYVCRVLGGAKCFTEVLTMARRILFARINYGLLRMMHGF